MKPDGFWRIPRIWPDRTVYILGGGPSLRSVDVARLKGQRVIACNNAYRLAPWIDVMVCMDQEWPLRSVHPVELPQFSGLKISALKNHRDEKFARFRFRVVRGDKKPRGLSTDPALVHSNHNSGALAINVAVQLGASRIILFGYDMRQVDKHDNWHADHKPLQRDNRSRGLDWPYSEFLPRYPAIADDLERLGVECINATPGSALTVFPLAHPESVMPQAASGDDRDRNDVQTEVALPC